MNNVKSSFPKSSVAAAVSLAIGAGVMGVASAATFAPGTSLYSIEWAGAVPSGTQALVKDNSSGAPTFATSAAYQSGDSVTITLSNASFSTASSISVTCVSPSTVTTTIASAANVTVAASTATFAVAANTDSGATCTFAGASLTNASLSSANTSGIRLAMSVARGTNTTVDTAAEAVMGSAASQLAIAATGFSNRISNFGNTSARENGRVFTSGTTTGATLSATLRNAVNDVTLNADTAFTLTISSTATNGLNWLKNNAATSTVCDIGTGVNTMIPDTGTLTQSDSSCSTIVYSRDATGLATPGAVSVDLGVSIGTGTAAAPGNFMVAQTFSGAGEWNYEVGTSSRTKAISLALGSFTATGSRVFVPYMPIGSGITQVMTVANNSNVAGTATISAITSSGNACPASSFGTVSLAPSAVTSLSSALVTGFTSCYGTTTPRTVALTVTVNAPSDGVEVFTSYNVNGNRVAVVNSSNGRQPSSNYDYGLGSGNSDQ